MSSGLLAGAASRPLDPPPGLPMLGFVRQRELASGDGRHPLEVGAIVLERDGVRVVLAGVDILGIGSPDVEALVARVAAAVGADASAVLLNWNHTHLAPPVGAFPGVNTAHVDADVSAAIDAFSARAQDAIVAACTAAAERLEPVGVVWGQRSVDLAVNRRERTPDGSNGGTILGWNPDELVDDQVTVLQLRRPDDSVLATAVGFGCHPVTTGYDMHVYSADFPGPMRDVVRGYTGGECVFLQGAGGNVLPRFAFTEDEHEAEWMGRRLGLAALEAVADRWPAPQRVTVEDEGSVTPISRYRREPVDASPPVLAAARTLVELPLQPHPSLDEIAEMRHSADADLEEARRSGDVGRVKVALYYAGWAARTEAALRDGTAPHAVQAPVHAVRVGDGLIVTAPAETFTEIGIAVKERAPGAPTLYAGYVNGALGYVPTAPEYAFGGYEADYGFRSGGHPSHFDPSCAERLVEAGVRLGEQLFPEVEPWDAARGWEASGDLSDLGPMTFAHPGNRAAR